MRPRTLLFATLRASALHSPSRSVRACLRTNPPNPPNIGGRGCTRSKCTRSRTFRPCAWLPWCDTVCLYCPIYCTVNPTPAAPIFGAEREALFNFIEIVKKVLDFCSRVWYYNFARHTRSASPRSQGADKVAKNTVLKIGQYFFISSLGPQGNIAKLLLCYRGLTVAPLLRARICDTS